MTAAALDAPNRIRGVDLARGLAVLGMFAAHLLWIDPFDWTQPGTWIDLANGRSSILFATLAGVSIGLVSGGVRPVSGHRMRSVRGSLLVRAVVLWLIGLVLVGTGVPVYVILPAYGVLFLLAQALLTLRARALWTVAAVCGLVTPWVQPWLDALLRDVPHGGGIALLVGWHYPFTVWVSFLAAGLAAARSDLRSPRTAVRLALGGGAAAVLGYGLAALVPVEVEVGVSGSTGVAGVDADAVASWLSQVWTAEAHSSGLLEVIGSGGWAIATLGVCLLVCRVRFISAATLPLRAVGSMPLTAYVGQLLIWAVVASIVLGDTGDLAGFRALEPFWPFVATTVVACTAWALLLGRGPLEALLARIARLDR